MQLQELNLGVLRFIVGLLGVAVGAEILVACWGIKDRWARRKWGKFLKSLPKPVDEEFVEENATLLHDEIEPGLRGDYFPMLYERFRVYLTKLGNFFFVHDIGWSADNTTRYEEKITPYKAVCKMEEWSGEQTEKGQEVFSRLKSIDQLSLYKRLPAN